MQTFRRVAIKIQSSRTIIAAQALPRTETEKQLSILCKDSIGKRWYRLSPTRKGEPKSLILTGNEIKIPLWFWHSPHGHISGKKISDFDTKLVDTALWEGRERRKEIWVCLKSPWPFKCAGQSTRFAAACSLNSCIYGTRVSSVFCAGKHNPIMEGA